MVYPRLDAGGDAEPAEAGKVPTGETDMAPAYVLVDQPPVRVAEQVEIGRVTEIVGNGQPVTAPVPSGP